MPFCPNCKNEYRKGFTECHECKIPLVDSLSEVEEAVAITPKKFFDVNDERSYEFLDKYKEAEEEERESEIVAYQEFAFTEKNFEAKDDSDLAMVESVTSQAMRQRQIAESMRKQSSYVDKKQQIEEYKSSGYVLLGVGVIGLITLILLYFGYIPGFKGFKSNYMFMGVMLVMFVVFIISGIMSFAQIKTIILEAKEDDDLTAKVKKFMDEHLTAEKIAKEVVIGKDDTNEELYFKRAEYMTRILFEGFPDVDEALREKLIDERYGELYENHNS